MSSREFVVDPLAITSPETGSFAEITSVGPVLSYVQLNSFTVKFECPVPSLNIPLLIFTVTVPSVDGVRVAVYIVEDDALKSERDPPTTTTSVTSKSDVAALDVNTIDIVGLLEVEPFDTSDEVIFIVSTTESRVNVNTELTVFCLFTASVNDNAATVIVHTPSVVGVNVAVYI